MLLRLDEYGRALHSVNPMLASTPHDCRLLSLRGMALDGIGQQEQALDSYKTALRFCPDNPLALQNAAQIEYARHQPDAIDFLNRMLKLNAKDKAAHAMLASIYRANDECAQALPHFQASTGFFAGQPQYRQAYAFCLAKTGHNRQAQANYQQILGVDPDPALRYNLALVQYRLHHPAAALATLQPLLATSRNQSVLALGAKLYRIRAQGEHKLKANSAAADLRQARQLDDRAGRKATVRFSLIDEAKH